MRSYPEFKDQSNEVPWAMLLLAVITWLTSPTWGQAQQSPPYPKADVSVSYVADPAWPQRPAGIEWAAVPGVTIDRQHRIWVFTRAKPPVQIYSQQGKFLGGWGGNEIKTAHFIKVEKDESVWVSDVGNHVVMQFTPDGKLIKQLGTRGVPGDDASHFNMPTDMVVTSSGDVFVSDGYGNNRVVHFDRSGKYIKSWGRLGVKAGEFSLPHAIAVDSKGRLYVADRNNARVQVFDQSGKVLDVWENLLVPWGFCVLPNDETWVCGSAPMTWAMTPQQLGVPPKDQLFMKFSPAGKILQLWTVPKGQDGQEKPGELNWVHGIAVDSEGNIYAGDIAGKRVQKFVRHKPSALN